ENERRNAIETVIPAGSLEVGQRYEHYRIAQAVLVDELLELLIFLRAWDVLEVAGDAEHGEILPGELGMPLAQMRKGGDARRAPGRARVGPSRRGRAANSRPRAAPSGNSRTRELAAFRARFS